MQLVLYFFGLTFAVCAASLGVDVDIDVDQPSDVDSDAKSSLNQGLPCNGKISRVEKVCSFKIFNNTPTDLLMGPELSIGLTENTDQFLSPWLRQSHVIYAAGSDWFGK